MTAHCACGERLLLTAPGRATCERCRLGHTRTPAVVHPPRVELREECTGCGAFTGCADGRCLGCRLSDPQSLGSGPDTLPHPREALSGALSAVSEPFLFDATTAGDPR